MVIHLLNGVVVVVLVGGCALREKTQTSQTSPSAKTDRNSAPREKPEGTLTAQIFYPSIEMNEISIV